MLAHCMSEELCSYAAEQPSSEILKIIAGWQVTEITEGL